MQQNTMQFKFVARFHFGGGGDCHRVFTEKIFVILLFHIPNKIARQTEIKECIGVGSSGRIIIFCFEIQLSCRSNCFHQHSTCCQIHTQGIISLANEHSYFPNKIRIHEKEVYDFKFMLISSFRSVTAYHTHNRH